MCNSSTENNTDHGSPGKPFGSPGNSVDYPSKTYNNVSHGSPGKSYGSQGNPNDSSSINSQTLISNSRICQDEYSMAHGSPGKPFGGPGNPNPLLESVQPHDENLHGSPGKPHGAPGNPFDNSSASQSQPEKSKTNISLKSPDITLTNEYIQPLEIHKLSTKETTENSNIHNTGEHFIQIFSPDNLDIAEKAEVLGESSMPETEKKLHYIELGSPTLSRSINTKTSKLLNPQPSEEKDRYIVLRSPEFPRMSKLKKQSDILAKKDNYFKTDATLESGQDFQKDKFINEDTGQIQPSQIEMLSESDEISNIDLENSQKQLKQIPTSEANIILGNFIVTQQISDQIKNDPKVANLEKSLILEKQYEQNLLKDLTQLEKRFYAEGIVPSTKLIDKISEINYNESFIANSPHKKEIWKFPSLEKQLVRTSTSITSHIADINLEKNIQRSQFEDAKTHLIKEPFEIISHIINSNVVKSSFGDKLSRTIIKQAIVESSLKINLELKNLVLKNVSCNETALKLTREITPVISKNVALETNSLENEPNISAEVVDYCNKDALKADSTLNISCVENKLSKEERKNEQISRKKKYSVEEELIIATQMNVASVKPKSTISSEDKINILKELISKIESPKTMTKIDSEQEVIQKSNITEPEIITTVDTGDKEVYNLSQKIDTPTSDFESSLVPDQSGKYTLVYEHIYENLPLKDDLYKNINYHFDTPIYENVDELKNINSSTMLSKSYEENIYDEVIADKLKYFKDSYINPLYDEIPASKSVLLHGISTEKDKPQLSLDVNSEQYNPQMLLKAQFENTLTDSQIDNSLISQTHESQENRDEDYKETSNSYFLLQKSLNHDSIENKHYSDSVQIKPVSVTNMHEMETPAVEEHIIENVTHIQKSGKIDTLEGLINDGAQSLNTEEPNLGTKIKLIIIDNDKLNSSKSDEENNSQHSQSLTHDISLHSNIFRNPKEIEIKLNKTISLPEGSSKTDISTSVPNIKKKSLTKSGDFVTSPEILSDPSILLQSLKIESNKEANQSMINKIKSPSSMQSSVYQFEEPSWIAQAKRNKYHRLRKMTWSTEDDPKEAAALTDIVKKYEDLDKLLPTGSQKTQDDIKLAFVPPLPTSPPPSHPSTNSEAEIEVEEIKGEPDWMTNIKKKKYHRKDRVTTEICGTPFVDTTEKYNKSENLSVAQYLDVESRLKSPKIMEMKNEVERKVPKKLSEMRKEYLFSSLQPDWMMEAKRNKYYRMQKMKVDSDDAESSKDAVNLEQESEKINTISIKKIEENEKRNDLYLTTKHSFPHEIHSTSPLSPASSTSSEPSWISEVRRLKERRERRASIDSQSSTASGKLNPFSEDCLPSCRDDDSSSGVVVEHNKTPLEVLRMFERDNSVASDHSKLYGYNSASNSEPRWLSDIKKHRCQRLKQTFNIINRNLNEIDNSSSQLSAETDVHNLENKVSECKVPYVNKISQEILNKDNIFSTTSELENKEIVQNPQSLQDKDIFQEPAETKFISVHKFPEQNEVKTKNYSLFNYSITQNMSQDKESLTNNVNLDNSLAFSSHDKISEMTSADLISEVKNDKSKMLKLGTPQPYKSPSQGLTHSYSPLIQATNNVKEISESSETSDSNNMNLYKLSSYQEPSWIIEAKKNKQKRMKKMGNADYLMLSEISDSFQLKCDNELEKYTQNFDKNIVIEEKTDNDSIVTYFTSTEINSQSDFGQLNFSTIKDKEISKYEVKDLNVQPPKVISRPDAKILSVINVEILQPDIKTLKVEKNEEISKPEIEDLNLQPGLSMHEKSLKQKELPSWVFEAKKMQQRCLEKIKLEQPENQISRENVEIEFDVLKTNTEVQISDQKDITDTHIYDSDSSSIRSEKVDYEETINKKSEFGLSDEPTWLLEARKNKLKRLEKQQARTGSYTLVFNSVELPQSSTNVPLKMLEDETDVSNSSTLKRTSDFIIDSGLKSECWPEAVKSSVTENINEPLGRNNSEKEIIVIPYSFSDPLSHSDLSLEREHSILTLKTSFNESNSPGFDPENLDYIATKSKLKSCDNTFEESFQEEPSWVMEAKRKQLQRLEKMKMIKQQKGSKTFTFTPERLQSNEPSQQEIIIPGENVESHEKISETDLSINTLPNKVFCSENKTPPLKFWDSFEQEKPSWISEVKKNKRSRMQKLGLFEDPECVQTSQDFWKNQSDSKAEESDLELRVKQKSSVDKNLESPSWKSCIRQSTYERLKKSLLQEKEEETKIYSIKSNVRDLLFEEEMELMQQNKEAKSDSQ